MSMKGEWKIMEAFNVFAGICSIVGLFVSLFVASKVQKISHSNNNNSGNIQQGDGNKNIADNNSVIADNHSSVKYNVYNNSEIYGEIDEPPTLTEIFYPITTAEIDKYQLGISKSVSDFTVLKSVNTICFTADFKNIISKPDDNRWIGYSIKSLPMKDWRSFVNMNYCLEFDYAETGFIKEIWLEITNFRVNKKICKRKLELSEKEKHFSLKLSDYKNIIDDWQSVDEICFVFFPENCIGQNGVVLISNMSIRKI